MAVAIACDHCGKNYSLSPTMAGKRVRCKACGEAFAIVIPGKAPVRPMPPSIPRAAMPTYSVARPARQSTAVPAYTPPPAKLTFDRVLEVLARIHPNGWWLLACLPIAAGIGLLGNRMPSLWWASLIAFPAVALLLMFIGLFVFLVRAARTPGELKRWCRHVFPDWWTVVLFLLSGIVLAGIYVWVRRIRSSDRAERNRYNVGATQGFWAILIGLMPLLTIAVSFAEQTFPPDPPTHRPRTQQIYQSPVPTQSLDQSSSLDALRMAQSEQKLRWFASIVITKLLNHHQPPAHLSELFNYNSGSNSPDLRSPFNPDDPDAYVYIPENLSTRHDDRIIFYDRDELDVMGFTQAITNSFQVLKLTKEQLLARQDLPQ